MTPGRRRLLRSGQAEEIRGLVLADQRRASELAEERRTQGPAQEARDHPEAGPEYPPPRPATRSRRRPRS